MKLLETKMRVVPVWVAVFVGALAAQSVQPAWGQGPGFVTAQSPNLTADEARKLKNPVPFNRDSIAAGKLLYFSNRCADCHGANGKAQIDILANATDLTDPNFWNHGTEPGEIFKSIRDGAGPSMPPFKATLNKEADLWALVNFIQSLWPADRQPKAP